ncbi:MAG: FkbM family methyltransferase [Candidatus Nomurabacteria bacterium]|jgi:FkbM family methyltransferase|nr:FkbM family methyltransferase [Candidatus Nomurabacteria bacterium]
MLDYRISYAQNREDILLDGILKDVDKGFYIDVGANHPIELSVTKLFYDKGWHGINIEPIAESHSLFMAARPRDVNLNIALSDKPGEAKLRYYPDGNGVSTISVRQQDKLGTSRVYEDRLVEIDMLASVMKKHASKTVHFLKIDVEGLEPEVLKGNDWTLYRPWVVCIESIHDEHDKICEIMSDNKYILLFDDGINKYFLSSEKWYSLGQFSYADTVLSRPIVQASVARDVRVIKDINERLAFADQNNQTVKTELCGIIDDYRTLRGATKLFSEAINRSFLFGIEKLNTKKPADYMNVKTQTLDVGASEDIESLLDKIRNYDKAMLISKPHQDKTPLAYKLVKTTYMVFEGCMNKVARSLLRMIKLVRTR